MSRVEHSLPRSKLRRSREASSSAFTTRATATVVATLTAGVGAP